jgi:Type II secretion system protein B
MSSPFIRKLRREVTANPKKTGVLAVISVVAIWFWIPLVAKWCGATEAAPAAAAPAASSASATASAPATAVTPAAAGATPPPTSTCERWQVVAERLERDPRMKPANEFGRWRDPFGPSAAELAAAQRAATVKQREKTTKAERPTPSAAGLVLSSTIVRATGSVAMINGVAYHEGNIVPAGDAGFTLVEIRPRQVVLACDNQRYELHLNAVEIAGSTTRGAKPDSAD